MSVSPGQWEGEGFSVVDRREGGDWDGRAGEEGGEGGDREARRGGDDLPLYHFQFFYSAALPGYIRLVMRGIGGSVEIRFETGFLQGYRYGYALFDGFVVRAFSEGDCCWPELPRRYPAQLLDCLLLILRFGYSDEGRKKLLAREVEQVLLVLLEEGGRAEEPGLALTADQVERLHAARKRIETSLPVYPGNRRLCQQAFLNLYLLNAGFKQLFGMPPYAYYNFLRMELAKRMLRSGEAVESVAFELGYGTSRAFGKAFKIRFGVTPKEWGKG